MPVLESSLIRLQALRTATLSKRDPKTGFLPLNLVRRIYEQLVLKHQCTFLRTTFFTEHLQWLLRTFSSFQPAVLLEKGLQQKHFSVNFAKTFKNIFWQNTSKWLFRVFICNLSGLSDDLFYRAPLGNCLFHVQVAEFQPPDTIKSISQVLFKHFIRKQEVAIRKHSFT